MRWARTPGEDAYWTYRDAFFDAILPAPGLRTLEIGCGEGRVARDLVGRGHRVTAVDTAHTLLRYAKEEDATSGYVRAGGAGLPFASGCFDGVVAYNSLQVVDDMAATVRESARVLSPGGWLCACISHPVTDMGRFDDSTPPAFTLRPDYFESVRVEDTVDRKDGASMTFRGWTYPLEAYFGALEHAGFVVKMVREPRPAEPFKRWRDVPLFMNFRAVKARGGG